MSLGSQEAFEIFKRDYVDSVTIEDNKQLLKQRFAEAKSLGEKVNEVRNKISNYKTMFNRLKALKIEIEHLQLLMEKAKVKLQKDFEVWWSEETSNLGTPATTSSPGAASPVLPTGGSSTVPGSTASRSTEPSTTGTGTSAAGSVATARRPCPTSCAAASPTPEPGSCTTTPSRTACSSIPLTGDSQTDADILAFIKARQNLLQKFLLCFFFIFLQQFLMTVAN
uniref:Kinesin-like protein KIF6/9 C-terminal domain-containing protein n=1 Tax=Chelydra serpentina TaxID=8475 RepID=A0A8C3SG48_CHESE